MLIQMNTGAFEMDIRALAMAFFPGEEIQVLIGKEQQSAPKDLRIVCSVEQLSVTYCENAAVCAKEQEAIVQQEKKAVKDQLKRLTYRVLSKGLKKTLPWGTLTGIRPIKIARTAMEQGKTRQQLAEELSRDYYISPQKRELMLDIAKTELAILKEIPCKEAYSLYVGIPFCPSTCAYCSFTSYPLKVWEKKVDAYVELLCREIDITAELFKDKKLYTIYVGGGTPTTLNPAQLDKLLGKLNEISSRQPLKEWTVEAGRPDSITKEKLQVLKAHRVTRISINPQTMQQKTLDTIGRKHTVEQTVSAYNLARSLGFDDINMDLIMGLPGEDMEDVHSTIEQIKNLAPDNLTIHSLAIKRAAKLRMFKEDYEQYKSVNTQEMMDMAAGYAKDMGMIPYYLYRQKNMTGNFENVGYATPDKIGLYNILIMEEMQTIAGVGAGASTKIVLSRQNRIERVENVKEVQAYMERFDEMIRRKKEALRKTGMDLE